MGIPICLSKRKRGLLAAINQQNVYTNFEKKILSIENRVDAVIANGIICPVKIKFMERYFGFETFIRNEAQQTIEFIQTIDLVEDMNPLLNFEEHEKTTNAKKLLKVRNSLVLRLAPNVIIQRIQQMPRYNALSINGGKIQIRDKKDINVFLKLLGDDFLKSELTEEEYDSTNKKILEHI